MALPDEIRREFIQAVAALTGVEERSELVAEQQGGIIRGMTRDHADQIRAVHARIAGVLSRLVDLGLEPSVRFRGRIYCLVLPDRQIVVIVDEDKILRIEG